MIVVFTDFGLSGPYIGQVKAVLHQLAPGLPIIDLFADLPAANPKPAAYLLASYGSWFPPGTVLLAVVDPGVGGACAAVVAEADGRSYVGPDNGLFEIVLRRGSAVKTSKIQWPRQAVGELSRARPVRPGGGAACCRHVASKGLAQRGDRPASRLAGRLGRNRLHRRLWKRHDRATRSDSARKDRVCRQGTTADPRPHLFRCATERGLLV
jgi:S-adenosyl-l-methionine hydroxide adenosyltransferase